MKYLQLTYLAARALRGCAFVETVSSKSSGSLLATCLAKTSPTGRPFSSLVPESPTWKWEKSDRKLPELDEEMIEHLERLSLVEFNNEAGVERLRSAIEYANLLHAVDTTGVAPMYSVLEDREQLLREDRVTEGGCRAQVLQNATRTEEDYFVAPPGNIPLAKKQKQGDNTPGNIPLAKKQKQGDNTPGNIPLAKKQNQREET